MERQGFHVPLLVGGATTSKAHTAIKIAPNYGSVVAHVADASLVVDVCNKLLNPKYKQSYIEELKADQIKIKERFEKGGSEKKFYPFEQARQLKYTCDWDKVDIPNASRFGAKVFNDLSLEEIVSYIDWSPFFWTWEIRALFPRVLEHKKWGAQAKELYKDALSFIDDIIKNQRFSPQAITAIWPANSIGESVEVYADPDSKNVLETFHFLRQQRLKDDNEPCYCLSDFIAPKSSGRADLLGGFVVSAGRGVEDYADFYEKKHDDYSSIMIKAIGDRIAEALAEMMHKKIRQELGYGLSESDCIEDLIKENYRGIRPAPGYPACPDHTEKDTLWRLLKADKTIDVHLTENYAMTPGSSVSGLYFSHPEAKYFRIGSINRDQVEAYAKLKSMSVQDVERWLQPNLAY
jgi:5-methyltetrahydrofolate--homocysteine methyltransferase